MTEFKILFLATLLSLFSCSNEDDSNPTEENPQAENCKISTITYGFFSGDRVYTATYSGENLTELTSNVDKVIFNYDAQNNLTKKELFENGNTEALTKQEFTVNSNGQIVEVRYWDTYQGNLTYLGKDSFTYNENKLMEITDYDQDNTTIGGRNVYEWTGENPTKLSFYDENGVLECETSIAYNLSVENEFNSIFPYFTFQDIYDEDFGLYFFLGKNPVTNTTNSCSGNTDTYNLTLQSNGLINNVDQNGDLLWEFEYSCE
jgi:hypothetical protein